MSSSEELSDDSFFDYFDSDEFSDDDEYDEEEGLYGLYKNAPNVEWYNDSPGLEKFPEDGCPEMLRSALTYTITQNSLKKLKKILSSADSCNIRDNFGFTLLQDAIRRDEQEIFDYLLKREGLNLEQTDIHGRTALLIALSSSVVQIFSKDSCEDLNIRDYYAYHLIRKGANIHITCRNGDSFLHRAVADKSVRVTRSLLERDMDVDVRDAEGRTALHKALKEPDNEELACLLLYYESDPMAEDDDGYLPYEYAVLYSNSPFLQETLFSLTVDKHTRPKIHIDVLLELALKKSDYFHKILKICEILATNNCETFFELFRIEKHYLKILLQKCEGVIKEMIIQASDGHCIAYNKLFAPPITMKSLTNFNTLMESCLKQYMIDFVGCLKSLWHYILVFVHPEESVVIGIFAYMLSYGLEFDPDDLEFVVQEYGHCELFPLMLCHVDPTFLES